MQRTRIVTSCHNSANDVAVILLALVCRAKNDDALYCHVCNYARMTNFEHPRPAMYFIIIYIYCTGTLVPHQHLFLSLLCTSFMLCLQRSAGIIRNLRSRTLALNHSDGTRSSTRLVIFFACIHDLQNIVKESGADAWRAFQTNTYTHNYIYIYIMDVCMYACMHACMYIYICIYIYTYTPTYIYCTYIHI